MTAIDRTAYPRLKHVFTAHELSAIYTPTAEDMQFAARATRTNTMRCNLLVLLKCFQRLGYFPALGTIPETLVDHVRSCLRLTPQQASFGYETPRTLYRHHELIRAHLAVTAYGPAGRRQAALAIEEAAQRMDRPADLINAALDTLVQQRFELPAFSTLDKLTRRIRAVVNRRYFAQIDARLTQDERERLAALLVTTPRQLSSHTAPTHAPDDAAQDAPRAAPQDASQGASAGAPLSATSGHARLKARPERVTPRHLKRWQAHLVWRQSLGDTARLLEGIPPTKIAQWAAEARALDAPTTAAFAPLKRQAVMLCLVYEEQIAACDALVTMFLKGVALLHTRGKEALEALRATQRQTMESLISTLGSIAQTGLDERDDARFGERVRQCLEDAGGADSVQALCASVVDYNGNHYLPLLPRHYASLRPTLLALLQSLRIHAASADDSVERALRYVLDNSRRRTPTLPATISLAFASESWQRFVITPEGEKEERLVFNRAALELCVVTSVAAELRTGDLWVEGAGEFADLRAQLLPLDECRPKVAAFCQQIGIPDTAAGLVAHRRALLADTAARVDQEYPDNSALTIAQSGAVTLKRAPRHDPAPGALALEAALLEEMPVRTVLEGLSNVQHWTNFAQFFGPLSGSEPKLEAPLAKYLLTVFGYGANLGPAQLARHVRGRVSAQTFGRIDARHIPADGLDRGERVIIDTYHACALPYAWGDEHVAAIDGTLQEARERALMTEYHVRYGRVGGVAFHYVSSLYVALVSHFIPCGVWEGIYLIDAFLKNESRIQPTTIHAATQGQSAPIVGMAFMLGINLMPRIRHWSGLTLYRSDRAVVYEHIDALFTGVMDWTFIERHWDDLLQAMISIKEGRILPSTLLRKLGNYSRKNKLYQVFKAVGDVVRTVFLLTYLSRLEVRAVITQETNKAEAYHAFCAWVAFGGDRLLGGIDTESYEKRVKYTDLLANALILHNVVDMSVALERLAARGYVVTPETVSALSPYTTRNWKRFGEYEINVAAIPPPLSTLTRLFHERFGNTLTRLGDPRTGVDSSGA